MKVRLGVSGSQKVKFATETDTLTLKTQGASGTRLDGLDDVSTHITTNISILAYQTSTDTYVQRAPSSVVQLIAENVLGLNHGGTGRSTFPTNSIIFAANSTTMRAATGSVGHILQIASNGTPSFSVLDGGNFA